MLTTWRFRIKESCNAGKSLSTMARSVNFVWNFAKQTQRDALRAKSARLIVDKRPGLSLAYTTFCQVLKWMLWLRVLPKNSDCILKQFRQSHRNTALAGYNSKNSCVGEAKNLWAGFRLKLLGSGFHQRQSSTVGTSFVIGTLGIYLRTQSSNVDLSIRTPAVVGTFV
jgi:hypothetical protein